MALSDFISCAEKHDKTMVFPVLTYIEENHADTVYDDYFSKTTKMPTWRKGERYVAVGCRKHYLSIYFSNHDPVEHIANATPFVRANKACVNFSYARELPYEAIFEAIDLCLAD